MVLVGMVDGSSESLGLWAVRDRWILRVFDEDHKNAKNTNKRTRLSSSRIVERSGITRARSGKAALSLLKAW